LNGNPVLNLDLLATTGLFLKTISAITHEQGVPIFLANLGSEQPQHPALAVEVHRTGELDPENPSVAYLGSLLRVLPVDRFSPLPRRDRLQFDEQQRACTDLRVSCVPPVGVRTFQNINSIEKVKI
jgi:hypothetical protein